MWPPRTLQLSSDRPCPSSGVQSIEGSARSDGLEQQIGDPFGGVRLLLRIGEEVLGVAGPQSTVVIFEDVEAMSVDLGPFLDLGVCRRDGIRRTDMAADDVGACREGTENETVSRLDWSGDRHRDCEVNRVITVSDVTVDIERPAKRRNLVLAQPLIDPRDRLVGSAVRAKLRESGAEGNADVVNSLPLFDCDV